MPSTLDQALRDIQSMNSKIPGLAKRAKAAAADIFVEELRRTAPVYKGPVVPGVTPGMLKDSIRAEMKDNGDFVITCYEYGLYLEYGTSKMPAHPWIRKAYENCIDKALDAMEKIVLDGLEKAFLGGG